MHYSRGYNYGSLDLRRQRNRNVNAAGYAWRCEPGHPLSAKNGALYEHREHLYTRIGEGPHACHWCRTPVRWRATGADKLVVDHVNGRKADNDPDNLVPSCHPCNTMRGVFMRWVSTHRDEPFLAELFDQAKLIARGG